jgi:serine phosphatase RsbU (regulator of sigma subunit)
MIGKEGFMQKITIKFSLIYLVLSVINISFFITMIFENQMDLIAENSQYQAGNMTSQIHTPIKTIAENALLNSEQYADEKSVITALQDFLGNILDNYLIFTDTGKVLGHKANESVSQVEGEQLRRANAAAAAKSLEGKEFGTYLQSKTISFYFPFYTPQTQNIIISYTLDLSTINNHMDRLYRQAVVILIVLILVHLLVGLILGHIIVKPLMHFKKVADDISTGNFAARVDIKTNDEFALVGKTFNKMASSVESFITGLKEESNLMDMELTSAGQVQKGIYPKIRELEHCQIAVYDNPLEKVSGDFHDFIELPNGNYGFFIADVAGHGVPAALITMKIKELMGAVAANFEDPEVMMRFLNTTFDNMMERYSSYFTAYYLIYNPQTRVLKYSCAGHPTPIILHRNGEAQTFDLSGFVIGVSAEMSVNLNAAQIQLQPGDCIVLYSDGITEARSSLDNFLDEDGLIKLLQVSNQEIETNADLPRIDHKIFDDIISRQKPDPESCRKVDLLLERSVARFKRFTKDAERKDDETLIIIEVK